MNKRRTTHGMSHTQIYKIWCGMLDRCRNKNAVSFPKYGGRGITVCKRWYRFENFYKDMRPRPNGKSIERINNNGNYSLKNCRWATCEEQSNNTRTAYKITFKSKTLSLSQWSKKLGVSRNRIRARLKNGMSIHDSLFLPKKKPWGFKKGVAGMIANRKLIVYSPLPRPYTR